MNKVILFGNLGADPEYTPMSKKDKSARLKCRLATTERFKKQGSEEYEEKTEWHYVTIFGKRAEALSKILKVGMRILVDGRMETSSFEKDGEKRYSVSVIARDIELPNKGGSKQQAPDDREDEDEGEDEAEEEEAPPAKKKVVATKSARR